MQATKDAWVSFIKGCEVMNVNEVRRCTGTLAHARQQPQQQQPTKGLRWLQQQ